MRCVWLLLGLVVGLVLRGAAAPPEDANSRVAILVEGDEGPEDAAKQEIQVAMPKSRPNKLRSFWLLVLLVGLVVWGAVALQEDSAPRSSILREGDGGPEDASNQEIQPELDVPFALRLVPGSVLLLVACLAAALEQLEGALRAVCPALHLRGLPPNLASDDGPQHVVHAIWELHGYGPMEQL
ncbi:Hypothetical predicted protein [Podarcis lilfordi]|uniref:Uncharacterized protein n=1 Tax=Podarcis lilfordi TaxID=74358 RepID=A0AA35L4C3_9SAUR|nr:Hypothetical predicted protein [Podarcis lilfordi]